MKKTYVYFRILIVVIALVATALNAITFLIQEPSLAATEEYRMDTCTIRLKDCVVTGYSCVLGSGGCSAANCNASCNPQ